MARAPKKPGKSGHAVNYMTRQQALKKLQVTLADFRRLCILKGVYPRDPSKKVKGKDKTYYATKDIQYLLHEPVLEKIREIKTHLKKLTKARGKKDEFRVKQLEKSRPFYLLDHLVKERYPSFIDAIRDMDDALSMITLYAHLPSTGKIKAERTRNCNRLYLEFKNWIVHERALHKIFLSIKGCYFQSQIQGQSVTWLVPYEFSQELPDDVDYKVMRTFLELYETQLHFINFRLYSSCGLVYPPKIDTKLDAANAGLSSFRIERKDGLPTAQDAAAPAASGRGKKDPRLRALQGKLASLERNAGAAEDGSAGVEEDLDAQLNPDEGADADGAAPEEDEGSRRGLLEGLKVFISREVPRGIFEFVARAMGARVGWEGEGSPFAESDEAITHQLVDRDTQRRLFLSREYVQPQWLADCINAGLLLPVAPYGIGAVPPPHLSPFVDDEAEGYLPDQRRYILELQERSRRHGASLSDAADADADADADAAPAAAGRAGGKEEADDDDDDDEDGEGVEDGDSEGEAARGMEEDYRRELEAERAKAGDGGGGESAAAKGGSAEAVARKKAKKTAREDEARAKLMMPRKEKRLYEKIQFAKKRKEDRVRSLESKRAA